MVSPLMHVVMMARAPRRGKVKTRLAAEVGEDVALSVYRKLGKIIVEQIAADHELTVCYDPPDAGPEIEGWLGNVARTPQSGGDLGARLAAAVSEHFASIAAPVAIIGSDAPGVDARVLHRTAEMLQTADVVIGPALDGGYYLLAMVRLVPELLEGISWGSDTVFEETVRRCQEAGIEPALLPVLRDVDTRQDALALGVL